MSDDVVAAALASMREALAAKMPPPSSNGDGKLHFTPACRMPETSWVDMPGAPEALQLFLTHVHRAAMSAVVAPTAVLYAVLARITAMIPHVLRLPPTVAGDSPLTLFVMILGGPATGKTGATRVARRLLPNASSRHLDPYCDNVPLGSGQGVIESHFDAVKMPDEKKPKKTLVRHNAYLMLDEGEALKGLESNTGSVLLSSLCTLWSGDTVGQRNATEDARRELPEGSYTHGLVVAVQPVNAATILAKDALGVPQRVLWAPATAGPGGQAPSGEKPPWPGPLDWTAPEMFEVEHLAEDRIAGWPRHYLTVHPDVEAEIVDVIRRVQEEELSIASMDEHRMLIKYRVAGVFAVIVGTYHITPELWACAEIVMVASCNTRNVVVAMNAQANAERNVVQGQAAGYQEVAKRKVVEDDEAERTVRKMVTRIRGGTTNKRDVLRAVKGSKEKHVVWGIEHEWITVTAEANASRNGKPSERLGLGKHAPRKP